MAILYLELPKHVRDVELHRIRSHAEAHGDLGVCATHSKLVEDAPLGACQDVGITRSSATTPLHPRFLARASGGFPYPTKCLCVMAMSPPIVALPCPHQGSVHRTVYEPSSWPWTCRVRQLSAGSCGISSNGWRAMSYTPSKVLGKG